MRKKRVAGTRWTKKDIKPYRVMAAIFGIAGTLLGLTTLIWPFYIVLQLGTLFICSSGAVFGLISAGISSAIKRDVRRNLQFFEHKHSSQEIKWNPIENNS